MKYVQVETPNLTVLINVENICSIQYEKETEKLVLVYQGGNTTIEPIMPEVVDTIRKVCSN